MYQIDIASLKSMLEAIVTYRTDIEELSAHMEKQLTDIDNCWSGTVKEQAQETCRTILDIHCADAVLRLKIMEETFTEALRQAVLVKQHMRGLEDVIHGEEPPCGEAVLDDEAQYQGIIGFDEDFSEQVAASCLAAAEQALKHEELINGIVDDLQDILDLTDEQAAIAADCRQVENLEQYAYAYKACGEEMEEINSGIITALAPYAGDTDGTSRPPHSLNPSYDLERVKTLTEKGGLTPEEREELSRALQQMELDCLYRQGTEEEKWARVETLLAADTWTEEERKFLCRNLEDYVTGRQQEKLTAFTTALMSERCEERETAGGPALYYIVTMDEQKAESLIQGTVDNELANAYQYALAMKSIQLRPQPVGDPAENRFHVELGEWEKGQTTLFVSIQTSLEGGWCSIQVQDESYMDLEKLAERFQNYTQERLDLYVDLGLTGYVKYTYYEMIDMIPDAVLDIMGYCWSFTCPYVSVASTIQSYLDTGDGSKLSYYTILNGTANLIGVGEGVINAIWGGLEGLVLSLEEAFLGPIKHFHDIWTSPNSTGEKILETGLKTATLMTPIGYNAGPAELEDMRTKEGIDIHLARAQNVTGMPFYDIKEAVTRLEQMSPEEKEELGNEVLVVVYILYDKYILHMFSEETVKEISHGLGVIEGIVAVEVVTAALTEVIAADAAKVNEGGLGTSWADLMSPEDAARYNQFWDDAAHGLDPETRVRLSQWGKRPNADLYLKYREVYDNPNYFNQQTGVVIYPGENGNLHTDGFLYGVYEEVILKPGTTIDRYGGVGGKYFSPSGTPYEERALPPFMENEDLISYEVLQPIKVKSGEAAPWFDQSGGGTQYLSDMTIQQLLDAGLISVRK